MVRIRRGEESAQRKSALLILHKPLTSPHGRKLRLMDIRISVGSPTEHIPNSHQLLSVPFYRRQSYPKKANRAIIIKLRILYTWTRFQRPLRNRSHTSNPRMFKSATAPAHAPAGPR